MLLVETIQKFKDKAITIRLELLGDLSEKERQELEGAARFFEELIAFGLRVQDEKEGPKTREKILHEISRGIGKVTTPETIFDRYK